MRNTPYAYFTIGDRGHTVFDLSETSGLIQGVTCLDEPKKIKASALKGFNHLRAGEVEVFSDVQRVEIVEFGGYRSRAEFVSTLKTHVVELEAGAKLTGPIAWRVTKVNNVMDDISTTKGLDAGEISMAVIFVLSMLLIGYLSFWAAVSLGGVISVMGLALYFIARWERSRTRQIERMGSVYVLAPEERSWAERKTAEAA